MAAWMSSTWPGKRALALERTLTPATAKPAGLKRSATMPAVERPFSASQPERCEQITSGSAPWWPRGR